MRALVLCFKTGKEWIPPKSVKDTDFNEFYEQLIGQQDVFADIAGAGSYDVMVSRETLKAWWMRYSEDFSGNELTDYICFSISRGQRALYIGQSRVNKTPIFIPNPTTIDLGSGGYIDAIEDPFSWNDRKYKATLNQLKICSEGIKIVTSSDLVAHDEYLENIPRFSQITLWDRSSKEGFSSRKRLEWAKAKIKKQRPDIKIKITKNFKRSK